MSVYRIECHHEHGGQSDHIACKKQIERMQADLDAAVEAAKHDAWGKGRNAKPYVEFKGTTGIARMVASTNPYKKTT